MNAVVCNQQKTTFKTSYETFERHLSWVQQNDRSALRRFANGFQFEVMVVGNPPRLAKIRYTVDTVRQSILVQDLAANGDVLNIATLCCKTLR